MVAGKAVLANGRVLREGPFDDIWIQPAAGDAGGSLGAALAVWHGYHGGMRTAQSHDAMSGSFLGPSYDDADIRRRLDALSAQANPVPLRKGPLPKNARMPRPPRG